MENLIKISTYARKIIWDFVNTNECLNTLFNQILNED